MQLDEITKLPLLQECITNAVVAWHMSLWQIAILFESSPSDFTEYVYNVV